jgi:hypothetical protein
VSRAECVRSCLCLPSLSGSCSRATCACPRQLPYKGLALTPLHLSFDRNATITTKEGVPVASIGRSFANAGQVLFDKQTYILVSRFARVRRSERLCCAGTLVKESSGLGERR